MAPLGWPWREIRLLYDVRRDLIGLARGPQSLECVCPCAALPAVVVSGGVRAPIERLIEREPPPAEGCEFRACFVLPFGLVHVVLGLVVGGLAGRRGARHSRRADLPRSVDEDALALQVLRPRGRGVAVRV